METKCKSCHKKFHTKISVIKKGKGKFCSRLCFGKWLSKIKKLKLWGVNDKSFNKKRLLDIRKKHSERMKGKIPFNKGKKMSEKQRLFLSNYWMGRRIGEKHPKWKGGKWLYWRKQVLLRDDFTCKECGLKDELIMDIDHIKPIGMNLIERREIERNKDIELNGINNLQTLCPNCHKRKTLTDIKRSNITGHLKSP